MEKINSDLFKKFENHELKKNEIANIKGGDFPCGIGDYIYHDTASVVDGDLVIDLHASGFPSAGQDNGGYFPPTYVGNIC